ncbi:hypothetical protein BBP40_008194 [Aspergillus hancockii]|nr:hypothetical protein BBP40_008194 [Aspergillus hancockii]
MSAQAAEGPHSELDGSRSWSIVGKKGFDYITQRPCTPAVPCSPGGEVMLGGGHVQSDDKGRDEVGIWQDNSINPTISAYLSGIWPTVFRGERWSKEKVYSHVLQIWTGCMGYTVDLLPYVGKAGYEFTGRKPPTLSPDNSTGGHLGDTPPQEWITAGFCGDGMVQARLSGVAVGLMVVGRENIHSEGRSGRPDGKVAEWFPKEMYLSRERIHKSSIYKLAKHL